MFGKVCGEEERMVCGEERMVCGEERMVCGEERMVCGEEGMVCDDQTQTVLIVREVSFLLHQCKLYLYSELGKLVTFVTKLRN